SRCHKVRPAMEQTRIVAAPPGENWDSRWRIERELGSGATGVVYLATDSVQNRPVAIKLLSPQWLDNPEAFARFEREARMMARLDQHPNVVTLISHGERGR